MLSRYDVNQDGKVTAEEFKGPRQIFARADQNGDGTVTRDEFQAAMPKQRGDKPRPGLVIVQGGGWRSGDKRGGQWRSLPLEYAAKGYVAVSVNYRLTDEAPFPACVENVKCAVRWLRANAQKYNVDPQRIKAACS